MAPASAASTLLASVKIPLSSPGVNVLPTGKSRPGCVGRASNRPASRPGLLPADRGDSLAGELLELGARAVPARARIAIVHRVAEASMAQNRRVVLSPKLAAFCAALMCASNASSSLASPARVSRESAHPLTAFVVAGRRQSIRAGAGTSELP